MFLSETDAMLNDKNCTYYANYKAVLPLSSLEGGNKIRIVALINVNISHLIKLRTDIMSPGFQSIWLEIMGENLIICGIYREWRDQHGKG